MHSDLHIRLAREAVRHSSRGPQPSVAGRYGTRAWSWRPPRFPAASAARIQTR